MGCRHAWLLVSHCHMSCMVDVGQVCFRLLVIGDVGWHVLVWYGCCMTHTRCHYAPVQWSVCMWLDGPISHLLLMRRCVARGESPPLLGRVVDVAGCCAAWANCFRTSGGLQCPAGSFAPVGACCPTGYFAPGGGLLPPGWLSSQVRCRRSMGSVIACVKVALRAQLDRQGKH
jgi:hypothetical protein